VSEATPCGCCEGISPETPATVENRPGLRAIAYRSGTWAEFRATMLDALSTTPALAGLRTRNDDDFSIALLDAWSVACDILTFYQERIANESYLRTATELVSVGELAKLIGYKLRPGMAAAAPLAFTLDTPPPTTQGLLNSPSSAAPSIVPPPAVAPGTVQSPSGSPSSVVLPIGTRAQTIPDPGAQPATFETVAAVTVRPEWNAIQPRAARPPAAAPHNARADLRLAGPVNLKPGDALLIEVGGHPYATRLQRVTSVTFDTTTRTTSVTFGQQVAARPAPVPTQVAVAATGSSLDEEFLWASVKGVVWTDQRALVAFAVSQGWDVDALEDQVNALAGAAAPGSEPPLRVFSMGMDASLFGHNAVDYATLTSALQAVYTHDWTKDSLATISVPGQPAIDLDNVYPAVAGNRVYLEDGASLDWLATTAAGVSVLTRNGYLMSSRVARLSLDDWPAVPAGFGLRTTRVLVQTSELDVADVALVDNVGSGPLALDGAYLSLAVGQLVAVTGTRADQPGQTTSEVVTIAGLSLVDGYTEVTFAPELVGTYVRSTVTIDANVAPATHGETTTEILGSGDASQAFQRFALKQPPLTYISAATASGAASTLTVRVDGVAWTEVDWLYGSGPADRVYVVMRAPDGSTVVQFGDGMTGARPGSGANNIQATYRHGIGISGVARPGQISTLLTRPLGLKAVTNPMASSGAADPEAVDQARSNAPITVKTLDRIVSLEDVGDFAAASAGIAKAGVSWVWDGTRYVACVTVAGVGGAAVVPGTPQYANLVQAMLAAGDGTLAVALCSYVPVTFTVDATVTPDPALVGADVLSAVKATLAATFSFSARAFGQPVFASEVIAAVQNVPGVVAMTLDALAPVGAPGPQPDAIAAATATLGPQGLVGAQLLMVQPGPLPGVVLAT
jgi:hypothetical protein